MIKIEIYIYIYILFVLFKTANLTQMGTQLLQGQMDVQEQVLQYQYV